VVRGSPAVLIPVVALGWLLLAPELPTIENDSAAALAAGGTGLLALGAVALSLLAARDSPLVLSSVALAGALLTGASAARGATGPENVAKALCVAAVALLIVRALREPAVAVAVPLFVAAADVWAALASPAQPLVRAAPPRGELLAFELPSWGEGAAGAQLSTADVGFLAFFAACAWRYGFRRALTAAALLGSLVLTLALSVSLDRLLPLLPGLALALLLPNVDRAGALLRDRASA